MKVTKIGANINMLYTCMIPLLNSNKRIYWLLNFFAHQLLAQVVFYFSAFLIFIYSCANT